MITLVATNVLVEFFLPEHLIAGRCGCEATAGMPVPEASVNQNNSFPLWQNDIRATGKASVVQSITEPRGMQRLANDNFRLGMTAPDAGHHA